MIFTNQNFSFQVSLFLRPQVLSPAVEKVSQLGQMMQGYTASQQQGCSTVGKQLHWSSFSESVATDEE